MCTTFASMHSLWLIKPMNKETVCFLFSLFTIKSQLGGTCSMRGINFKIPIKHIPQEDRSESPCGQGDLDPKVPKGHFSGSRDDTLEKTPLCVCASGTWTYMCNESAIIKPACEGCLFRRLSIIYRKVGVIQYSIDGILTNPRASLTSRVANSQDSAGKLMLKFSLSCSSCLLQPTTTSDSVMGTRKALRACKGTKPALPAFLFSVLQNTVQKDYTCCTLQSSCWGVNKAFSHCQCTLLLQICAQKQRYKLGRCQSHYELKGSQEWVR